VQHVAVLAGWGGNVIVGADVGLAAAFRNENPGRLFVFALDGTAEIPEVQEKRLAIPEPPAIEATPEEIARGNLLYHSYCGFCHGFLAISTGATPDLRRLSSRAWERWDEVVLEGELREGGMDGFSDVLDAAGSAAIRAFVAGRAREDRAAAAAESSGPGSHSVSSLP
jgi:mono/diheme cytochrome c family protein